MIRPLNPLLLLLAFVLLLPAVATAQWSSQPGTNVNLGGAERVHLDRDAVSDGAGGVITVWASENYSTGVYTIYAQRVNADGDRLWGGTGRIVQAVGDADPNVALTGDGAGGAVIVWQQMVDGAPQVRAQHLSDTGTATWTSGGVVVCLFNSSQAEPDVVRDESGRYIVGWIDSLDASHGIYSQCLDASGGLLWSSLGMPASNSSAPKQNLLMTAADDGNTAWFVWTEQDAGEEHIFCQFLDGSGNHQLDQSVTGIYTLAGDKKPTSVVMTLYGGIIIAYEDYSAAETQVGVVYKSLSGYYFWTSGHRRVGIHAVQDEPRLVHDGIYGAFLTYRDYDVGGGGRIVAQRIDGGDHTVWGTYGRTVASYDYVVPSDHDLCEDGAGGMIAAWYDSEFSNALRAVRYSEEGLPLWVADRAPFVYGADDDDPLSLVTDGRNGALAVWEHTLDVYAKRVDQNGFPGLNDPTPTGVQDRPDDQGGEVVLSWGASPLDTPIHRGVADYSLWVRPAAKAAAVLAHDVDASEPVELLGMTEAAYADVRDDGWTYAGSVPATLAAEYEAFCPTFGTWSESGYVTTEFMVAAHHAESGVVWNSAGTVTGYSIDNLAPGAPVALAGVFQGGNVDLDWQAGVEGDLAAYRVYRSATAGVPVDEAHLVAEVDEPTFRDLTAAGTVFYRVTAVDAHDNEGVASAEIQVEAVSTGVGDMPTVLTHRGNHPNPFNPRTTVSFALPERGRVQVTVHDAAGRLVRVLADAELGAGIHDRVWNGDDARGRAMPSGTYFSRVRTGDGVVTGTMTLVR